MAASFTASTLHLARSTAVSASWLSSTPETKACSTLLSIFLTDWPMSSSCCPVKPSMVRTPAVAHVAHAKAFMVAWLGRHLPPVTPPGSSPVWPSGSTSRS
eukprot:scaffold965_cov262-Pinguiococcus_pyrenoidosus.AAC.11